MSAFRSDGQSSGWKHLMPASFILPMMAGTTSNPVRLRHGNATQHATKDGEKHDEEKAPREGLESN